MISLTLKGSPRTTNTLYATMCRGNFPTRYMTAEGKTLKEDYKWQAKSQYKKKPLKGELEVWTTLYLKTKRKADIDNFNKIYFDALSGIVWEDDSQIVEHHVSKRYDAKNPRIEVEVNIIE